MRSCRKSFQFPFTNGTEIRLLFANRDESIPGASTKCEEKAENRGERGSDPCALVIACFILISVRTVASSYIV